MTSRELREMKTCAFNASYNETVKSRFKFLAIKFLKQLAPKIDISPKCARFNPGGIAVAGDAILHGSKWYIMISHYQDGIMFRTCKGSADYTGGPNQWWKWDLVTELGVEGLANEINRQMKEGTDDGRHNHPNL